jgi:hypothetical protein
LYLHNQREDDVCLQVFGSGDGALVVAVLEEVGGVEGEKDSMNRVCPMGGLGSYRKVPMRWLQGDSEFPFGAFLYFG